jgi:hypothetical protein
MRNLIIFFGILFLNGCGDLKINPRGCKGPGLYANEKDQLSKSVSREYYAFTVDREVLLRDLVDCHKVKLAKIEIENKYLLFYKVKVSFTED